jgi:Flp pilus assembly protein TadD
MMLSTFSRIFRAALLLVFLAGCANGEEAVISESLRNAAIEAQRNLNYAVAASHFRKLRNRQPKDLGVLLGLARNLRYMGAANEAVRVLEEVRHDFDGLAVFHVEWGKAKLAGGKSEEAVEHFKTALEKDPGNWEIHSAMGIAYDLMLSFDEARKAYRKALELSKDNPAILNNMAISAAQAGDVDAAIVMLKRAATIARHSPQLRQNLALFYGIKGDFHEAEALSRMDLDEEAVRNNLAFYSRFQLKR